MAVEAFVVDLDGTVWDSRPFYAQIITDAAGLPLDGVRCRLDDTPLPTLIDRTPGITRARFARQIRVNIEDLAIYPTVRETLEALAEGGAVLAVATSLPGWIAKPLLDETGLRPLFSSVFDASSAYRKPNPQLLTAAFPGIELIEGSVLVVGDGEPDAELARRAKVGFAWAAYGYGSEPDLPKYFDVESFDDLLDL